MVNHILIKVPFLLISVMLFTLSTTDQILCSKNSTLLETAGDAILTVFVDANYGQHCNISSSKGLQQISTALYVIQILNKYDYVPDRQLGLRIFDTCHDGINVFKQVLQTAVEQSCAANYEMGILVPSSYDSILDPLRNYGGLPINVYGEQNFTGPMIDILVHYASTRYEIIDLVLASTDLILDRFMTVTRKAGVCVKHDEHGKNGNVTEAVVVAIGEKSDMQRWLREREELKDTKEKTWLLLPLDNSDIDDFMPAGSYVIKPKTLDFDDEFSAVDKFLEEPEDSAKHSPYLLGIGKGTIELAEILQDVRGRSCANNDDDDNESCIASQFRPESRREIRDSDVYEALRMQPSSHSVRYVVAMKTQHDLVDVAFYGIEASKLRVLPEKMLSGMPGLCLQNLVGNCENCTNFQRRSDARVTAKDIVKKSVLKSSVYIPLILIAIVTGTLVCCITLVFIVYRFASEEMLDGNPTLTIVLILANMFILLTTLPFCMADDYFGAEDLNARKILLTTLAFGFTFSIMLSRALFLALSTSSFIAHVNGYLQSLMMFFMFGVQVAMSVVYFVLNTTSSAMIARSTVFIALLGYDIFLLIAFFIVGCFIIQVQRNYYEGRCFFGTAISLLIVWAVWLICFVLTQPENRDTVVSFGVIGTGYSIILGILIPRIYYMIMHPPRGKTLGQRFNPNDLPTDSTINTVNRRSRPLYDYIHPVRENQILRIPSAYPSYYGGSSSSSKCLDRCRSPIQCEMPGYSNYGFHAEMKEIDATHIAPQTRIGDAEPLGNFKATPNEIIYAQPKLYRTQRIILQEKSNAEITYNRNDISPAHKLDEVYPVRYISPTTIERENKIDEENEDEEDEENPEDVGVSRVTRF